MFPHNECNCTTESTFCYTYQRPRDRGFYCTREPGHSGPHRACGAGSNSDGDHMLCEDWGGDPCEYCEFDGAESCGHEHGESICTRQSGHNGNHVECNIDDHAINEWRQDVETTIVEEDEEETPGKKTKKQLREEEREELDKITVIYSEASHKKIPVSLVPAGKKLGKLFGVQNVQFQNIDYATPNYFTNGVSEKNSDWLNVWVYFPRSYAYDERRSESNAEFRINSNFEFLKITDEKGFVGALFKAKDNGATDWGQNWNLILAFYPRTVSGLRKEILGILPELQKWKDDPEAYKAAIEAKILVARKARTAADLNHAIETEFSRRSADVRAAVKRVQSSIEKLTRDLETNKKGLVEQEALADDFKTRFSEDRLLREAKPITKMADAVEYNSDYHLLIVYFYDLTMTGEFVGVIHKYLLADAAHPLIVKIPLNSSTNPQITISGGVKAPGHPHMLSDGMCWGSHAEAVLKMRQNMQWAELIAFIKTFLQQPNTLESMGMQAQRWPEIKDGEYPINLEPRECCAFDRMKMCKEYNTLKGYSCTRVKGHEGNHIYCRVNKEYNDHNYFSWEPPKPLECQCVPHDQWCHNFQPSGRLVCSRAVGHVGEHVGCAASGRHAIGRWPNTENPEPDNFGIPPRTATITEADTPF